MRLRPLPPCVFGAFFNEFDDFDGFDDLDDLFGDFNVFGVINSVWSENVGSGNAGVLRSIPLNMYLSGASSSLPFVPQFANKW